MNLLRGYSVTEREGKKFVSVTYNEIDNNGELVKRNVTESFYVVDEELDTYLSQATQRIKELRFAEEVGTGNPNQAG